MTPSLDHISTFFASYEEREAAFSRAVGFSLARRHAGPSVFWQDFSRISRGDMHSQGKNPVAYIPSNPRDCLAFGSPRQVLLASLMSAAKAVDITTNRIMDTARRFEISDLLSQPIRTLSGGETVKLALAKTSVSLNVFSHLVVASPFTWLSDINRHLLESLVIESNRKQKPISILALEGEGDLNTIGPMDPFVSPSPQTVPFALKLMDVRIPLTVSLRPLAARTENAVIDNASLDLLSPCLIVGDNGQGKSLLARTIAHAVSVKGSVVVNSPKSERPACLLFQDVLTQTMLRSFTALSRSARAKHSQRIRACYLEIQQNYIAALQQAPDINAMPIGHWADDPHDLMDIKAILVAARLCDRPAALILDEPDWGMSRASAVAFVSAVLATAHRQQTPVLLISHKPWCQSVTRSTIRVSRTPARDMQSAGSAVFRINLNMEESPS